MKSKSAITSGALTRLQALRELRARFGTVRALQHATFRLINKVVHFDCLNIIALDRENLRPLDPVKAARLSTRIATLEDLEEMRVQGCWGLPERTFELFQRGDICLLSCVDGKIAGYTWALNGEHATLVDGLTLSVPREYLYNFCGFTHPDYRGYGLQSYRHHAVLDHPRWRHKKGLLGFVVYTNHSSIRGQEKSGYRLVGKIHIVGVGSRLYAHFGKRLRRMGIERVKVAVGATQPSFQ